MDADNKQVDVNGIFSVVSDGQLGVDAQAGVFTAGTVSGSSSSPPGTASVPATTSAVPKAASDEKPAETTGASTAEVTLNLGGFDITLNLKKGVEYSGADLAKEIANALNNPVAAEEGGDNADGNGGAATAALAADGGNAAAAAWEGKL